MVQTHRYSLDMSFRPNFLSLEYFIYLAYMEVKLGSTGPNTVQTWYKHGPSMVPKKGVAMDMSLGLIQLSLENFIILASLEVKLGNTWPKHGNNITQAWS